MSLTYSALFREASKQFKQTAYREFAGSEVGRVHSAAQQALRSPGAIRSRFARMARRPTLPSGNQMLRELTGVDFCTLIRDVAQYGRTPSPAGKLVREFLRSLGPIGTILENLALGGKRAEPNLDAMAQLLRAHGYTVLPPEKAPKPKRVTGRLPKGRKTIDLPMAQGPKRRFSPEHPIILGDMVPAPNSTNVHSFAYDYDTGSLFVRYWQKRGEKKGRAPGALYRYSDVEPELFLEMYRVRNSGNKELPGVSSPGTFVWERLREPGTISGHQKDYHLAGIAGGYVPRKATLTAGGETFKRRSFKTVKGEWLKSRLPTELVRPLHRGTPPRDSRG